MKVTHYLGKKQYTSLYPLVRAPYTYPLLFLMNNSGMYLALAPRNVAFSHYCGLFTPLLCGTNQIAPTTTTTSQLSTPYAASESSSLQPSSSQSSSSQLSSSHSTSPHSNPLPVSTHTSYTLYKTISAITLDDLQLELVELRNHYTHQERIYHYSTAPSDTLNLATHTVPPPVCESFMLHRHALHYAITQYTGTITLTLDCRPIFKTPSFGRIYTITPHDVPEDPYILITYTQYTDETLTCVEYVHYIVIYGIATHTLLATWRKEDYQYDAERHTNATYYVYDALRIPVCGQLNITIATGTDLAETMRVAKDAHLNTSSLSVARLALEKHLVQKQTIGNTRSPKDVRAGFAYVCATQKLSELLIPHPLSPKHYTGLWAGIPWFIQYWSRDELISLYALFLEGHYLDAKHILWNHLKHLEPTGRLQNIYPGSNLTASLASADSVGWLFARIRQFIELLESRNELGKGFTLKELIYIRDTLAYSIAAQREHYLHDDLIWNGPLETWMDTAWTNDGISDDRSGARIEIQALFLSQLKLYLMLDRLLSSKLIKKGGVLTRAKIDGASSLTSYLGLLESRIAQKVRASFLKQTPKGLQLCDGLGPFGSVIRPNIFIACYLYPELLSRKEWIAVIDSALESLWHAWDVGGGLSTIDAAHPLYTKEYTGETNQSYHRGDSWFWINHIAAICMHRIDKRRYASYITAISEAAARDILSAGFIGAASELSSSANYTPGGTLCQTWSIATYIELIYELYLT